MSKRVPQNKSQKKKKSPWLVLVFIFLLLILLIGEAIAWITLGSLNKIERVDHSEEVWIDPREEDFEMDAPGTEGEDGTPTVETVDPGDVVWGEPVEIVQKPNVHNILLIGQDRRPGEGRARSDSMIILSINEDTNQLILCSLMRDMYVPFPGDYSDNRINAAYAFGGMSLLDQLIREDFGIVIDGNVEVDFNGFMKVMDLIAPLEVELKDEEAWFINREYGYPVHTGVNYLNSRELLAYSQMRYVGHADFERTERQRRVLTIAFNKVRNMGVSQLMELANAALPCITTDLTDADILRYVYMVGTNRMNIGGNYRLPVEGTYTPQSIRGMSVLVPDLATNSKMLKQYLYP